MTDSLASVQDCLTRAVAIKESAETLRIAGDEWHAVCYFYAAYHTVRAAMLEDPVFRNAKRLSTFSPNLAMQDQHATSHHGYLGHDSRGRKFGVNDIVKLLYPSIAAEYVRLHMASVDVRYGHGLPANNFVLSDFVTVADAYTSGSLKAK